MKKKIAVNYTSRDFESIREELIRHAKKYYPNSYQDFNEAGFGSLMLDTVAYVGDMLSFYLDYQANESFLDTSSELENVIKLSRQMGYKYDNAVTATAVVAFYILVPASANGSEPDSRYIPILKKGSTFSSNNGSQFILQEDVRFDSNDVEIAIGRTDSDTGLPTYFAMKQYGSVISGRYTTAFVEVGEYKKFLRVEVPLENITEIISVEDSEGFSYFEVENLMQDIVYRPITNRQSTNDRVDNFLRPYSVPRRFVVEKNAQDTILQFGSGNSEEDNIRESLADPSMVTLKFSGRDYVTDTFFDPNKLTETENLGIVPVNTVLSITCRVNTTEDVNVASNSLTSVNNAKLEFIDKASLDSNLVSVIRKSVEVNNEQPITGRERALDTQDIKKMAYSAYSSQGRAVTRDDYKSLIYRMPTKYGMVKKVNVIRDEKSYKRNLNIYLLSINADGKLEKPSTSLKQNVRVWLQQNKMINDTIDLMDGKIVNLGIDFQITTDARFSKESVLANCINNLTDKVARLPEISEPFLISDVYKNLRDVDGVLDVVSVTIRNKSGGNYSSTTLEIDKQRSPDNRYIDMPQNAIWEIKFPEDDIKGVVV